MYHIILNGAKTSEKDKEQIAIAENVFKKAGKEYAIHTTEHAGHAREIAAEITSKGEYVDLVAVGGDGTLHEVLNGIQNIENCALGLIPIGTGNDFAEAAHLPEDVHECAENIVFRAPTYVDYIQLDNGLRSINAVGAGIDVDVLKRAYAMKSTKKNKYFSAFLKSLRHYKSTSFKVSWDGGEEKEFKGLLACIGNGTQIGGGIKLFPDAVIDDGYMDLIVVDYLSRFRTIIAFLRLVSGKVNKVKEVTHVRCRAATIVPITGTTTIQAEGELYDDMSIKATLVSNKLKFYLPKR